jgi:F0F1-type ATP synthase assembly protein I
MKRNRATVFLSIGLLIISATQVALHFTKMPDFISGVLLGIGLGVMLLSFKRQKSNPAC